MLLRYIPPARLLTALRAVLDDLSRVELSLGNLDKFIFVLLVTTLMGKFQL